MEILKRAKRVLEDMAPVAPWAESLDAINAATAAMDELSAVIWNGAQTAPQEP